MKEAKHIWVKDEAGVKQLKIIYKRQRFRSNQEVWVFFDASTSAARNSMIQDLQMGGVTKNQAIFLAYEAYPIPEVPVDLCPN